jgi:hypothetical protein
MKRLLLTSALGLLLCSSGAWAQQSYDLTTVAQAQGSGQYVVYFGLDQSSLSAEARATIAEAARAYQSGSTPRISVRAHTDTSGSSDYNQRLSERREQAVANELIAQGVPQSAITGEALGETDPAVPTGDGVVEASNRRVDIQVEQPAPVAEAAPAPAPEPMPEPTPPPAPRAAAKPYRIFNVGAFYGYNLEDEVSDESQLGGINIGADFPVTPWLSVGLEQAGFYHFDTPNDGAGGRTVASLDLTMGDDDFKPYIGGNVGYLYGSGFEDDFVGGPEIGLAAGPFLAKVAYDIPFNRDLDEGIINTTIGIRF